MTSIPMAMDHCKMNLKLHQSNGQISIFLYRSQFWIWFISARAKGTTIRVHITNAWCIRKQSRITSIDDTTKNSLLWLKIKWFDKIPTAWVIEWMGNKFNHSTNIISFRPKEWEMKKIRIQCNSNIDWMQMQSATLDTSRQITVTDLFVNCEQLAVYIHWLPSIFIESILERSRRENKGEVRRRQSIMSPRSYIKRSFHISCNIYAFPAMYS